MASPDSPSPAPDDDGSGILLGGDSDGVTAADLYDPATGKAMLVQGYPVEQPPPAPDARRAGLIDSGVIPEHPQLRNLVVSMKDFTGNDPIDRIGHGTIVAIQLVQPLGRQLAAQGKLDPERAARLAGSTALVSAKVTGPNGRIELEHVIEAVHWMATQHVPIVNMSLAFLGKRERYARLCEAIAQCGLDHGTTFVVAAGNFGPNVACYPAACGVRNVLSVGAVMDGKPWAQSGKGHFYEEGRKWIVSTSVYYYEAGAEAARAGDYDAARKAYQASLAEEENAAALFQLALLDAHEGYPDLACKALTRAAELDPAHPEIWAHLGAMKLRQDRPAEAMADFDRALALEPNNVRALTNRGLALMEVGHLNSALDDLIVARGMAQDTSRIDAVLAEVVRRLGLPMMTRGGANCNDQLPTEARAQEEAQEPPIACRIVTPPKLKPFKGR
jgi:tetratricopeptide (TPR) repeat protein